MSIKLDVLESLTARVSALEQRCSKQGRRILALERRSISEFCSTVVEEPGLSVELRPGKPAEAHLRVAIALGLYKRLQDIALDRGMPKLDVLRQALALMSEVVMAQQNGFRVVILDKSGKEHLEVAKIGAQANKGTDQ